MQRLGRTVVWTMGIGLAFCFNLARGQDAAIGIFEKHGDVGATGHSGALEFDAKEKTYRVTGGGENMWASTDALHFVWKPMSGNVSLAADVRWIGTRGNEHRKACLLIRQGLEPDSAYVDAVVHGDGLASMQYREVRGGATHEIQSNVKGPRRLRIEKDGDVVSMSIAPEGAAVGPAGGSFKLKFTEPFLVGLGICAHDNRVTEQAVFSNVEMTRHERSTSGRSVLESTLETIAIASTDRRVVYHGREHFEAPNWSRDGKQLFFNRGGRICTVPITGGEPQVLDTGFAIRCNNDHGLSPDGTQLVISDQTQERQSLIYILPATGGTPRRVTARLPSYWHGWSPDGKTLVYCAQRDGEFDVYSIPAAGGEETRLTTAKGLDDGPEYSPDGKHIFFNSNRAGQMHLWRMYADGSEQTQFTDDEYNNWFPHPSPDGRWIVFLSYEKDVEGHPANKDVLLRLMPVSGGPIRILAKLFGGQGTINVPSWSPDSRNVAFVSYRLVNDE